MAKGISHRISLEDGEQVKQVLQQLGQAGQQAFRTIGQAVSQTNFDKFKGDVRGAGQELTLAKGAADQLTVSLRQVDQAGQSAGRNASQAGDNISSSFTGSATKIGLAFVALGVTVGAVIKSLASGSAETAKEISETADKLGLTSRELQVLRSRANEAGVDTDKLEGSLGKLRNTIKDAAPAVQDLGNGVSSFSRKFGESVVTIINGTSLIKRVETSATQAADALAKLGLSSKDIVGADAATQFQKIFDALKKMADPVAQNEASIKLFGKNWRELQDIVKAGGDVFTKPAADIRLLTQAEIDAGVALDDAKKKFSEAFKFLKDVIGSIFAPGQTRQLSWLADAIDGARKLLDEFLGIDRTIKGIAGGPKIDLAEKFDLTKFTEFLRSKGSDGLASALDTLRGISADLATIWNSVLVPAGKALLAAFDTIAKKVNEIFGTNVTGRFIAVAAVLGVITGAFSLLSGILTSVLGVIGLVVLGFAALSSDAPQLDGIKDIFKGIGVDINGLTTTIGAFLSGVWKDLVAAFQGRDIDVKSGWVLEVRDFFKSIPGLIAIGVAAFLVFRGAIISITPLINRLFGTTLNPTQVGAIAVLGLLTDALKPFATILVGAAAVTTILVNAVTLLGPVLAAAVGSLAVLLGLPVGAVAGFLLLAGALLFFSDTLRDSVIAQIKQVGQDWQDFKKTFQEKGFLAALQQDLDKFKLEFNLDKAIELWKSDIAKLQALFAPLFDQLKADWNATLDGWTAKFNEIIDGLTAKWREFVDFVKSLVPSFPSPAVPGQTPEGAPGPGATPQGIGGFNNPDIPLSTNIEDRRGEKSTIEELAAKIQTLQETVQDAMREMQLAAEEGWAGILASGNEALGELASTTQTVLNSIIDGFNKMADIIESRIDSLKDAISQLGDAVASIGASGGGGPEGFAAGGYTGDRGAHQIAGVVHGKEYVEPAHVVAKPGVRAFLELLHRMGGDLQRTFSTFGAPAFSLGGFVERAASSLTTSHFVPGFADGGFVPSPTGGGLHPVTIQFANGRSVGGFFATPNGLDQLGREAVLSEAVSAGTPPRWV